MRFDYFILRGDFTMTKDFIKQLNENVKRGLMDREPDRDRGWVYSLTWEGVIYGIRELKKVKKKEHPNDK